MQARSSRDKRIVAGLYASFRLLGPGDTLPCFQEGCTQAQLLRALHRRRHADASTGSPLPRLDKARLLLSAGLLAQLWGAREEEEELEEFCEADVPLLAQAIELGYHSCAQLFMRWTRGVKARSFFMSRLLPPHATADASTMCQGGGLAGGTGPEAEKVGVGLGGGPGERGHGRLAGLARLTGLTSGSVSKQEIAHFTMASDVCRVLAACIASRWEWGIEFFVDCVRECIALGCLDEQYYGMQLVLAAASSGCPQTSVVWMEHWAEEFRVARSFDGRVDQDRYHLLDEPALYGRATLPALEWLAAHSATAGPHAMHSLGSRPDGLRVAKWFHSTFAACSKGSLRGFRPQWYAKWGSASLEGLQWLLHTYRGLLHKDRAAIYHGVTERGSVECMQWLSTHHVAFDATDLTRATRAGNLAVVRWLTDTYQLGVLPAGYGLIYSCTLDCARYLYEECGIRPNVAQAQAAATAGAYDVLRYLETVEPGMFEVAPPPPPAQPSFWPISTIRWSTCLTAVCRAGYLDCVEWLHGHCGIPFSPALLDGVGDLRHSDVAEYVLRQHPEADLRLSIYLSPDQGGPHTASLLRFALARAADLRKINGQLFSAFMSSARRGRCAEVRLLLERLPRQHRESLLQRAFFAAVSSQQFAMVEMLHRECGAIIPPDVHQQLQQRQQQRQQGKKKQKKKDTGQRDSCEGDQQPPCSRPYDAICIARYLHAHAPPLTHMR